MLHCFLMQCVAHGKLTMNVFIRITRLEMVKFHVLLQSITKFVWNKKYIASVIQQYMTVIIIHSCFKLKLYYWLNNSKETICSTVQHFINKNTTRAPFKLWIVRFRIWKKIEINVCCISVVSIWFWSSIYMILEYAHSCVNADRDISRKSPWKISQ